MKYFKLQQWHHQSPRGVKSTCFALLKRFFKCLKKQCWCLRKSTEMNFLIFMCLLAISGIVVLVNVTVNEKVYIRDNINNNYIDIMVKDESTTDYDVKDDNDLIDFNPCKWTTKSTTGNNDTTRRVIVMMGNTHTGPILPWFEKLPNRVEDTLPHYPFSMTPTDGSWQIVNGTRFKFFVFSAYYDRRDGGKLIRVIGATKTRGPERVWCRLWYIPVTRNATIHSNKHKEQQYKSVTVMARVKVIRENWNLKYSACFVLCPIRPTEYDIPQYISIVARLKAPPGNLLLLRNTDWDSDFQQTNHSTHSTNSNISISSTNMTKFPANDQIPDKLAICVKPFHFDYDQALFLMEYLEFYALLGVSHFTFYNHTIGRQADCVLQHYIKGDIPDKVTSTTPKTIANVTNYKTMANNVKDNSTLTHSTQTQTQTQNESNLSGKAQQQRKGYDYIRPTVQMLPWNLRMRSQKEIRTEGLFAALNDCLYRTMYRYKYLALVDLDEFIVPRYNDTLIELINSLNSRFRNHNTGAYSFQNAFFYLQFGDDPLVTQIEENESMEMARLRAALVTQRKTRRRAKLNPQKQRSKYICKPETVVEAGNHVIWEFLPGKGSFNVPPTEAILQHYRVCEFGGNDCIKAPSVLDRTATKYVKNLMVRVYEVYKHLKHKCKLPELPPLPPKPPPSPNTTTSASKILKANRRWRKSKIRQ